MSKASLVADVKELARAAELSVGRADEAVVKEAQRVSTHVDRRLAFSGDATIVALAGATGSGKSSTFNAISQTTLARADVKRPTTSKAMAGVWADEIDESYNELLVWLDVPERNLIPNPDKALRGLVLLDLPDHDSTESKHRMEVDRLVQLVDVFVWVVDPQKYADAALHDHYLRPLAQHAEVMIVALNQADRVPEGELGRILKDLRGLLDSEGLEKAQLLAISAKTGMGIDDLRGRLARVVRDKTASATRLAADVDTAANSLRKETGTGPIPGIRKATVQSMTASVAKAAGEDTVVDAVLGASRRRGTLATGWPFVKWIAGLKPDPLKRLHLGLLPGIGSRKNSKELAPAQEQRTSLPMMGGVARATVDGAVRTVVDEASAGLPRGWAEAVREASRSESALLADDLDRAIAKADLGVDSGNGWWWIFRILQWVLTAAVVVGGLWLLADFALAYFQFPKLPGFVWHRLPLPTWLVIGGAGAGIVLSALARVFVEIGARRNAAVARRNIREAIASTAVAKVVEPVRTELDRYAAVRQALDKI